MCPHCTRDAPIVYRGLSAFCAACGGPRTVLSSASLTFAGKPEKVGGVIVKTLGYLALTFGLATAALIGLLVGWIATATAGWIVGGIIGFFTLALAVPAMFGGRKLEATGESEVVRRRTQTVFALAANRDGRLRATDAARALNLPEGEADAFLTHLAKTRGDEVGVDVTDQGDVVYVFPRLLHVEAGPSRSRTRVGTPPRRVQVPVTAGDADLEIIDAEFEEIADAKSRHRR